MHERLRYGGSVLIMGSRVDGFLDSHHEESVRSAKLWLGIAVLRGLEAHRPVSDRLLEDPVSLRLLAPAWRFLLRLFVLIRLDKAIMAHRERQLPGVIGNLLCRTRYIDDALRRALEGGAEQVVILGAGFDTRAYRIPGMDKVHTFEVDLPEAEASKRKALERGSVRIPKDLVFVPVDFELDGLGRALAEAGFRSGVSTFYIWEGVTQYISRKAIEDTLEFIGASGAAGSRVAFSYIQEGVIRGDSATAVDRGIMAQAERGGAPWRVGLDSNDLPGILAGYGLRVVEDVGGNEYRDRYLEPTGRRLATLPAERVVLAEVVNAAGSTGG
jgi:methyltransferase (TIGR00027 family)